MWSNHDHQLRSLPPTTTRFASHLQFSKISSTDRSLHDTRRDEDAQPGMSGPAKYPNGWPDSRHVTWGPQIGWWRSPALLTWLARQSEGREAMRGEDIFLGVFSCNRGTVTECATLAAKKEDIGWVLEEEASEKAGESWVRIEGEMRGSEERGGRREEETAVVVEVGDAEEEEEWEDEREGGNETVLRWEKFLPRMPVRVLLVEGDYSTRQIIAALLRKCSYRVAATSDGLKAWDALKENPQSIDLVLTEVDLPSISGFGLLTMIMDHDACKNIPVIMMSSHDSMSMVFKCMLQGAADFLTKPIRKNELRNLWQHVWRRQIVSGDYRTCENQVKCDVKDKPKSYSGKIEHSVEYVAIIQANKECSEQGSDAQSSCTRSDVEAESTHNILELKLPQVVDALMDENGKNNQVENTQENAVKGCLDFNDTKNETCGEENRHDITFKDLELFRGVQLPSILPSRVIAVNNDDATSKSSPMPHLELSLKRYEGTFSEKQQCDESNAWNHSSSSAFSLYCRALMPNLLTQQNSVSASNGLESLEPLKDQGSVTNMEESRTLSMGTSVQDGMTVQCTPIQVIPVPVGDVHLSSGHDSVMEQMFYPPSDHSFWSSTSSIMQQSTKQANFPRQTDHENLKSAQAYQENAKSSSSSHSAGKQDEHMELDEQMHHVSSAAGESVVSSINHLNSSESGSVLSGTTGHASATHAFWLTSVNGNDEDKMACERGNLGADCLQLTQREMALNKFRLKRKERCFEKKVRYQSRKLLAEQRPRVKGQFVRLEKFNSQPRLAVAFQSDSAAG